MTTNRNIIGVFNRLGGSALTVHQERCVKVRNRNVECLKCAEACTSGCISLVEGALTVDAAKCVGCGTCATVCPTCALEARNPSDAQLYQACLAARCDDEVVIVCEQMRQALAGLLDESHVASVVCLGRIDESLICGLAAEGVKRVRLVCGRCDCCDQKFGLLTVRLVADSSNSLLAAWGSDAWVAIDEGLPAVALRDGACPDAVTTTVATYFQRHRGNESLGVAGGAAHGADAGDNAAYHAAKLVRVMHDATLPHFVPDRRERLLDSLAALGKPVADRVATRLWGCVVIDGAKCSSCRMCATFCPTGAIRKFDFSDAAEASGVSDATFGVDHFPGDCVKCGSCRDVCPEQAIQLLDEVKPSYLLDGAVHHYAMRPRPVLLGDAQQIMNTMRQRMKGSDVFER